MKPRTSVAALLLLCARPAAAHDTWILSVPAATPGSPVRLEMTSGMAFPDVESGISADRVARAQLRLGGRTSALPSPLPTRAALRYEVPLAQEGVATLWVELAPRTLDLEPKLIDEYLAEIGAAETIGPRWRARPEPKRWREVYRKHAKTFVRVGGPAPTETSWSQPTGMDLELLPETDPTALVAGGTLTLVLIKKGKPLAGLPVAAERGAGSLRRRSLQTSDAAGRVTFTLDRSGAWLFAATELREKGSEWESDFTTLTAFVPPPAPTNR